MAKTVIGNYTPNSRKKRPGIHSKNNNSNSKKSKNYVKAYDREDSMDLSTLSLFNSLTDEDFLAVHECWTIKKLMFSFKFRYAIS